MDTQQDKDKHKRDDWDTPKRWRQAIPSPPQIEHERRLQLAREWLEFLGCEVTEERIRELAPVVMRYHPLSPKGQVANHLVTNGVVPYRAVVEAEYRRLRKQRFQQAAKQARVFLKDSDHITAVCEFIADYRNSTGTGPLWREVAEHLDLAQETVAVILPELAARGLVSFTTQTRSLDVATRGGTNTTEQA